MGRARTNTLCRGCRNIVHSDQQYHSFSSGVVPMHYIIQPRNLPFQHNDKCCRFGLLILLLISHFEFLYFPTVLVPTPQVIDSILIAGTKGHLSCNYTLTPSIYDSFSITITWFYNNLEINASDDDRISTAGQLIAFSPVSLFDSGIYACKLNMSSYGLMGGFSQISERVGIFVESKVNKYIIY